MAVDKAGKTSSSIEDMPTILHPRVHCGFEPEYAIQHYSGYTGDWQFWDCAYTRVEADNLLASYNRRYKAGGHEWRLAKIVYTSALIIPPAGVSRGERIALPVSS
jgi:hypothetical protein